ncbi:hypothetical protein ACVIWV_009735 [Bradyrhizobium diazoefficiens]|jgi:hypothetical protein|uniref:hypothetical protein n=1 Tax=Bradyrhizobium TaxID=374 RepID=UPI00053952DC|nr:MULTISPECIES: hypothetical protein [Bradyrhizobium]MBR0868272.1 hypothetical protein [Bradyrhizobium diazoefficiens]MBR0892791.1 hypothetical protein [Bradyrhizobium diazoefficiens]MBR0924284.1 hypothetical protein [Bradyrhizobium diazoefficiens]WLA64952.1 hypothetical protein QNN01_43205 [Bradyrhizobium diazoefficiens]BAP82029.1 hypothetical protein NK6_a_127 [Bradyrhizobium diazoefficiens]
MAAENKNAGKTDNVQPKTVGLGKSAELSLSSLGGEHVFLSIPAPRIVGPPDVAGHN